MAMGLGGSTTKQGEVEKGRMPNKASLSFLHAGKTGADRSAPENGWCSRASGWCSRVAGEKLAVRLPGRERVEPQSAVTERRERTEHRAQSEGSKLDLLHKSALAYDHLP